MGTNYYLHTNVCPHCGRGDEPLHIGKSSWGWCFSLHVIPERGINTLDDWRREWSKPGVFIRDEYSADISLAEMEETITERGRYGDPFSKPPHGYPSWADFHANNNSEPGPSGLLRHRIGGRWDSCVGHGEGTWDYITGEFS